MKPLETTPLAGYSGREITKLLGITDRRLRDYLALLRESNPGEFNHPYRSSFYSPDSFQAIKKVRTLFSKGATATQVKQILRLEGW